MKTFRQQIKECCGDGWYVRNNRGRMRLIVQGHGSVSLNYPWSLEGSTRALPYIQQLFKRWDDGRISLGAAATSTQTSSSHQKLDFAELIETYREFVPNASDKT